MKRVRFGALGAARIAPAALIEPAGKIDRCDVLAVAARDPQRATRFARRHDVSRVVDSYEDLIRHPDVDAVYIGLPASHHARWTLAALRAGKHVLCEKPFTTSAEEAEEMVALADELGLVLCEAFHYRYHPFARRVRDICASGELGAIEHAEGCFYAPIGDLDDIRYVPSLGGGATMDLGTYPLHMMRTLFGAEPEVTSGRATERPAGVDETMVADLRFPTGSTGTTEATAHIDCSMAKEGGFKIELRVRGSEGELFASNFVAPHIGHELRWSRRGEEFVESFDKSQTTYDHQLEAFVSAVLDGGSLPTGGIDAIANMRAIDAIYRAAGLPVRRELV